MSRSGAAGPSAEAPRPDPGSPSPEAADSTKVTGAPPSMDDLGAGTSVSAQRTSNSPAPAATARSYLPVRESLSGKKSRKKTAAL